jgi:hypothetical protein
MYSTPPSFQGSLTPNNYGVGRTRQTEGGLTRLENVEDNRIQEEIKNVYDNNRVENLIKLREAQLNESKSSSVVDDNISDLSDGMKTNSNRGNIISSIMGTQKTFRNPLLNPFNSPSFSNMTLPSKLDDELKMERIYNRMNESIDIMKNPISKKNKDTNLNVLETRNNAYSKDEIPPPRPVAPSKTKEAVAAYNKAYRQKKKSRNRRQG